MKQLVTKRLILREWEAKDAEGLYAYAKNPNVGPNAGWKPHRDVEESLEIINAMFIPNQVFAMVDKETGKIIGSIGLEPDKRRPNIES
ncbi:MAG: GNAT family N-acetyltransferase, partial [Anaerovorax sp.]